MQSKFKVGDRVQVISKCNSYGNVGNVENVRQWSNWNPEACDVTVRFDCDTVRIYSGKSLQLINSKGVNGMTVKGNYNVAMVKFVDGTNKNKEYAFALFDNDIIKDDFVLCDTAYGYNVGKITSVVSKEEYVGVDVKKEVVCKVDFSAFNLRKAQREEKNRLKKQMDKMVADNQELVLYQAIAEKNPAMAELLKAYKELKDV